MIKSHVDLNKSHVDLNKSHVDLINAMLIFEMYISICYKHGLCVVRSYTNEWNM